MLRGIAILGVLMVHATSSAVVTVQNSWVRDAYTMLNAFSLFCVPAFIFLSGFVLFYNYFDRPLTVSGLRTFYGKRLKGLILPYVLVSLGYELVKHMLNHRAWDPAAMLRLFGEHLLAGNAYPHLYYILITIQLYLLFPLLLLLFRKVRGSVEWAIPLGFVIQWAFYLLNRNVWHMGDKGSWSLTYFSAFLLGAYLGMRFETFRRWMLATQVESASRRPVRSAGAVRELPATRTIRTVRTVQARRSILAVVLLSAWLAVTVGFIWMHVANRSGAAVPDGYWFEIGYNLFTLFTTLLLLKACVWIRRRKAARLLSSMLADLGALSFGIYLIHPIFLLLYHRHPPASAQPVVYHLWTAGGYLFALAASLLVLIAAHRYIRGAWILFGPTPSRFQAQPANEPQAAIELVLAKAGK